MYRRCPVGLAEQNNVPRRPFRQGRTGSVAQAVRSPCRCYLLSGLPCSRPSPPLIADRNSAVRSSHMGPAHRQGARDPLWQTLVHQFLITRSPFPKSVLMTKHPHVLITDSEQKHILQMTDCLEKSGSETGGGTLSILSFLSLSVFLSVSPRTASSDCPQCECSKRRATLQAGADIFYHKHA